MLANFSLLSSEEGRHLQGRAELLKRVQALIVATEVLGFKYQQTAFCLIRRFLG